MLKISFLLLTFIFSCSIPTYHDLSKENKEKFKPSTIDFKEHINQKFDVYSIDNLQLDTLVSLNSNKKKILYFNQVWCEGDMNALKCLLNRELKDFEIIVISGLDWIWTKSYRDFLDTNSYNLNIYIMDIEKYPMQNSISLGQASLKKYKLFLKEFFDELTFKKISENKYFPTFFIINDKKELLYESSGSGCFVEDCEDLIDNFLSQYNDKMRKK
jgi:hypothetical protein